ncbi:hypothetical protein DL762_009473 [Monosporascus cannonballus]|uniref:Nucleolar 27S pre-rRNA processing Urb2/Npa2 C-terminal domain-containing protein n=1 Tax=Monosporascus cannonballus TaxID=155416 RepID=A0ABY0GTY2_9PEZI|nr:hypothetical protein DL762_009473 [Monosporascus cannonballus]
MDAMDIDSHAHSGRTALIRAVRSLDENGDLTLSDKILNIWKLLSASKATRLHSVEETILRWLFKQMTGASQDAEQVRRYPLSWTVLHHAFLKIPPQALGRILADRKFTAILRQTLEDIYKSLRQSPTRADGVSTTDTEAQTKKRKRSSEISPDIGQLRTQEGCMKTGVEIFGALAGLLAYGDRSVEAGSPEKKVGVEHIRSLFSSSTEETREITSKLLWICDGALSGLENGISQEQEHWVGILSTLWNLHLHSKEDTYEFARHLYPPICSIIAKLKELGVSSPFLGSQATKDLWLRQLEQFLDAQFIRPARQRFAVDGSVEILKAALAITASKPSASCNVMWDVAARTPRDLTDTTSKLEHASWAQKVFAALLEVLESAEEANRNGGVTQLLETALTTGSIPNTATLREVCNMHALQAGHTDWQLLAKIVKCDSDVFLMDNTVLENLLDVITDSGRAPDLADYIVVEVVIPLLDAYIGARDVSGSGNAIFSLERYVEFIFRVLPRLADLSTPDHDALLDLIVSLFSHIRAEPEADVQTDLRFRKILQTLHTSPAVEDEESVIAALISQPLDAVTKAETQCGWTQPQSLSDIWTLLDFPIEALTRGRRKRIISSWKTWKSDIATQASLNPSYADAVLHLLVRIMQQPTFYEKMEFEDLVYIASNMTQNGPGRLSLVEKLIDLTLNLPGKSIELQSEVVAQLEAAAKSYASEGRDVGWKLRKFLVTNYQDVYGVPSVFIWLEEPVDIRAEDSVYEFVEAFVKANDQATKNRLLDELVGSGNLTSGSTSALLAVKKVIEQQEQNTSSTNGNGETIDIATIQGQLAPLLTRAATIRHFNHLSAILLLLLDNHSNSTTQFGIELTLNSVIDVCSPQGPNLQETRAAGQVYDRCYQLVATIIKRHRRRLDGHFPILLATLQAMLRVLLADPTSPQAHRHPPWLSSRLQARHAARFARLLTLICEPSAASVARSSTAATAAKAPQLDSATDAAKRAAGQDMFLVLETYIRLQLEADVPRDVRKALETGVYSVLNVTPQGCRRVLNESLDANGRALFRQMYADYKKFGRWSGV